MGILLYWSIKVVYVKICIRTHFNSILHVNIHRKTTYTYRIICKIVEKWVNFSLKKKYGT